MFALRIWERVKENRKKEILDQPKQEEKGEDKIDQSNQIAIVETTNNEDPFTKRIMDGNDIESCDLEAAPKTIQMEEGNFLDDKITRPKRIILLAILTSIFWGILALVLWLTSNYYPSNVLLKLSFLFYGIGSILYGSGYVLITYVREAFVLTNQYITQIQLFDAVSKGQFTPGPLTSTVTVIGYMIGGIPGAIIASFLFFLPSFLTVIIINPLVPRLRKSKWTMDFLDAINISSITIMFITTYFLGKDFIITLDIWSIVVAVVLFVVSIAILLKWKKVNSAFLILAGAIIGGLLKYFVL
ncbi:MAG: chromate transporter [Candidatus Thorarchaeota archaeon]